MTAQLMPMPSHVDVDGGQWRVERAWPSGSGVALELSHPDEPHRRAAQWDGQRTPQLVRAGTDPRLPTLEDVSRDGVVVSHRLGRRAVVRSHRGEVFTKVVRPGKGANLLRAARAAEALEPHVRLPRILAADDERLVLSALPGRSLLDLATAGPATWERAWRDWADSWVGLVTAADPAHAPVRHDASSEAEVLQEWLTKAEPVVAPLVRERLAVAVERAVTELASGLPSRTTVCHRDLHDQQVLWHPEHGIGLLDVDTLAAGEAALDLGNLRAHVALRHRQRFTTRRHADVARRSIDGVAEQTGVDLSRVRTYERASTVRLVCVYAFRPRWRDVAARLLDDVEPG